MFNTAEINPNLLITQQLMEAAALPSHAQIAHGIFPQATAGQPGASAYILSPFYTANNPAAHVLPIDGYLHANSSLFNTTQQSGQYNASAVAAAQALQMMGASINGTYNHLPTRADRLEVCQQYLRGTCLNEDNKCALAHPPLSCPIDRSNGQVTVCVDYVKQKCHREVCKYFHPPDHLVEQLKSGNGPANVPNTPTSAVAAAATALLQARRFFPSITVSPNPMSYIQPGMNINPYLLPTISASERNSHFVHAHNANVQNGAVTFDARCDTLRNERNGMDDEEILDTSTNDSGNSSNNSGKKRNYSESIREDCVDQKSIVTSTPNSHSTPPKRPVIEPVLFDNSRNIAMHVGSQGVSSTTSTTVIPTAIPVGVHGHGIGGTLAGQNYHPYHHHPILQNLHLPYQHGTIGYQPVVTSNHAPFMQPQLVNFPYGSIGPFCYQLQPALASANLQPTHGATGVSNPAAAVAAMYNS